MKKKLVENLFIVAIIAFVLSIGSSLVGNNQQEISPDDATFHFLAVGQGDATLVTSGDTQILIDGGPDKSVIAEMGKYLPFYDKKIEAVILSHPHADHVTGLNYVLDRYEVEKIYLSGVSHNTPDFMAFLEKIKEKKIATEIALLGDNFTLADMDFDFFWPEEETLGKYDLNNSSLVFRLKKGKTTFLFPGDADKEVLEGIAGDVGEADVIKISHHGSINGSSSELVTALGPEYAVISCGENNYFGHPSKETLKVLLGVKVLRTDILGTIILRTDGNTVLY